MDHLDPCLESFQRCLGGVHHGPLRIRHHQATVAARPVGTPQAGIHQACPDSDQDHHGGKQHADKAQHPQQTQPQATPVITTLRRTPHFFHRFPRAHV